MAKRDDKVVCGTVWLATIILAASQWGVAQAACNQPYISPRHNVENVTAEVINGSSVLVRYVRPMKQWISNDEMPERLALQVYNRTDTHGFSWLRRKLRQEYHPVETTSMLVADLPLYDLLAIRVTPTRNGFPGCRHEAVNIIIRPPEDGVWSNWSVVRECKMSITCDDLESTNSSVWLDQGRLLQRNCTPPQNRGKDCLGLSELWETCPPLEIPICNRTNGNGINHNIELDRTPVPSPIPGYLYAIGPAIALPLLLIVGLVAFKFYRERKYTPSGMAASRPYTMSLGNFSMPLSETDNVTYLDLPFCSSCANLHSWSERPTVYVAYAHSLPTPSGQHQSRVKQLAEAMEKVGLNVIFPAWQINQIMEAGTDRWFEDMQRSGIAAVLVVCSKELVKLWRAVSQRPCFETTSERLAYHELTFVKELLKASRVQCIPVSVDHRSTGAREPHDHVPSVIRDANLNVLHCGKPDDRSELEQLLKSLLQGDTDTLLEEDAVELQLNLSTHSLSAGSHSEVAADAVSPVTLDSAYTWQVSLTSSSSHSRTVSRAEEESGSLHSVTSHSSSMYSPMTHSQVSLSPAYSTPSLTVSHAFQPTPLPLPAKDTQLHRAESQAELTLDISTSISSLPTEMNMPQGEVPVESHQSIANRAECTDDLGSTTPVLQTESAPASSPTPSLPIEQSPTSQAVSPADDCPEENQPAVDAAEAKEGAVAEAEYESVHDHAEEHPSQKTVDAVQIGGLSEGAVSPVETEASATCRQGSDGERQEKEVPNPDPGVSEEPHNTPSPEEPIHRPLFADFLRSSASTARQQGAGQAFTGGRLGFLHSDAFSLRPMLQQIASQQEAQQAGEALCEVEPTLEQHQRPEVKSTDLSDVPSTQSPSENNQAQRHVLSWLKMEL